MNGLLSGAVLALASTLLSFAMVMSQSRAGQLEMAGTILFALALRRRAGLRISAMALLAIGAVFAAFALGWTSLCEALYLPSVRDGTMGSSNGRIELWRELLHAAWQQPWAGYGWNQVSVAQVHVAADLPPFRLLVEHSHNIAIDLLLWNGIPAGLALIAAAAWWLWRHVRACRDGNTAWYLAAVVAMLLHALVEFPHDYAYLLFPVGVIAGAAESSSSAGCFATLPRRFVAWFPLAGLAVLVWIASEYLAVEENYRSMRFESARIGTGEVSTAVPSLLLLTQLREFLHVARHPPEPGMSPNELERMRRVADRYAYASVLMRHALASALNGQAGRAALALKRLCHLHPEQTCREALDSWAASAASDPRLATVSLPARP
jgi:Virulence factor membrane-bound polymerase, C-terminal/O-Antigen ligase